MPELIEQTEEETPKEAPVQRKIREKDDMDLLDYLSSLNASSAMSIALIRERPKSWKGHDIVGTIETFEEPISEEDIRESYGGGTYKLVIKTPDASGSMKYRGTRKIKIAGDPKLDGLMIDSQNGNGQNYDVVKEAMRMTQQQTERAQRIADQERNRPREDDMSLRLVMQEMAALRQQMSMKDEKMFDLVTNRGDSATERLLGQAIEGESARMQALRAQMDSEIRMKNEMHKAEIDRLHSRYEDIARRQDEAAKREIDNLNRTFESRVESLKLSHDSVVQGYKREIGHLDRELTSAKTELAELRAKKDKGFVESLAEIGSVKEALEAFGGKDSDEGASTWERIANSVMSSPVAEGIAARLSGASAGEMANAQHQHALQGQQEEEMEIPINRPVQLPDGRVIVRKPDGTILQLRTRAKSPQPTGEEPTETVSDEELLVAVQFMEGAMASDTEPEVFARAAVNLVPSLASGPLREMLKTQGVDVFLERVAKLSPGSSLVSQAGKNWTRKVAAALLES